jgi:hypothetical protein
MDSKFWRPLCIAICYIFPVLILRQTWNMSSHMVWHACEFVIFGASPNANQFVTSSHRAVIFHVPQYLFSSRQAGFEHAADHFNYETGSTPLLGHVTNKWDFREESGCSGRLNISSESAVLLQLNIHKVERPVRVNALLLLLHLWGEWIYIDWMCFQEVGKHANMQLDAAQPLGPALSISRSQFNCASTSSIFIQLN